jgi:5-methylthioadenosine/S-adenosylhomocysteine deaminase
MRVIYTLKHHKAGVAHNPSSNLKLASGIAPVSKMLNIGLDVGIGTDGPASNNDMDMFEEIRLAAFLAKTATNDPTTLPAQMALTMATRLGAKAIQLGHLTGSLEAGKRADLIMVDHTRLHNSPRFHRDPNGIYAQLVYAAKSSDVTDVMVNGRWLMRQGQFVTLDNPEILNQAAEYAHRIDTFLSQREKSVLSKLIAIGGTTEGESFEVQSKVRIHEAGLVLHAIQNKGIEVLRYRRYHEFDTYFLFDDPQQGTIRYREDEYLEGEPQSGKVRYRLTLIGPAREAQFPSEVLLSRSRFLAPATHSLRFYREYFKPTSELFIEKERQRWRVLFQGTEFYVNLDNLIQPDLGYFLEVKSRTWSRKDAEHKAMMAIELLKFLGASDEQKEHQDYLELARSG